MRMLNIRLLLPCIAALAIVAADVQAQDCPGDCNYESTVAINELVGCTAIALDRAVIGSCDACDVDGNTRVTINELIAAVNAALAGCATPPQPSAVAQFELSPEMPNWGDVPFPNELYRDQTGAIRIGALPIETELPIHVAMRDEVQRRAGFCATCNIYFAIDGDIDRNGLPAGSTAATADAVLLADVDPTSPERGRLFPLRFEWNAERGLLAIRPAPGIALHRNRRYAAAVTTSLEAVDGSPLGDTEDFRHSKRRQAANAPEIEEARALLAPALDELERVGVGRNRIVALAAFTTEDVTADVLSARAAVQTGESLAVVIDRRRVGEEIDELLGIPGEDRPGIDVPPASGIAGTRSIVHSDVAEVITGSFLAPRIVTGAGTEIGTVRRDDSGAIVAGPREAVPFVLTLPAVPAGAAVPLIVAHHGFSASRVTGFASANTAARVGVAVLAIDGFQHGERAVSAKDELHGIRGNVPGPDGFAETESLDVSAHVFGLSGAEPGLELFAGYSLGALMQFGADVASAVRVVRDGALAQALRANGLPEFGGFDAERIGYIGNSLGAVVGASVLTAEPDVRYAVQNVPPGSIVETLAQSPEFRPLVDALFLPLLGVEGPFDEVERHLLFDPVIDLSRWILEPIDPLALAPYLIEHPVREGGAAEILFQVASLDEVASSLAIDSMLAATGSDRITRYDPAAHGMLEVLNQVSRFEPPAAPPYRLRGTPLPVANPIVDIHAEIEAFLSQNVAP